jgi:magnesium chelatase family protein
VLARVLTFSLLGVDGVPVTVEADIHSGLPAFTIVGLPDAAVQESRERVRAALINSGFEFPLRRITVNLAPADLRKAGPGFDLALAAAVLAASGQVRSERLASCALCGELGLDGSVRSVRGSIVMAQAARAAGCSALVVPRANAAEAALIDGLEVAPIETLLELVRFLAGELPATAPAVDAEALLAMPHDGEEDFAQLRGHPVVRRALEVAAAGAHNVFMVGPPGSGKSMAARRLPSILPPLTLDEALAVTRVHSVAGVLGSEPIARTRPFRAPHHSISPAGLVGGGTPPSPGEASLAQHGVLFLDELAEFSRSALEALRQPLEEGSVRITRAQRSVTFPARFMLVGASNPCPCGLHGDPRRDCTCPPAVLARYRAKLSGALLDRIDIVLRVEQPSRAELRAEGEPEPSAAIRERVIAARARQRSRLSGTQAACNAQMRPAELRRLCRLDGAARRALADAHDRAGLTMRGHDRAMRVARTLADLDGCDTVQRHHVAQAVAYRAPGRDSGAVEGAAA